MVVIGLGSVGIRVLEGLQAEGREVVVVERNENNRFLNQARALGAPVLIADSTQRQTLEDANVHSAAAVAVLTSDDLTNIETGLAVRDYLGERWVGVPGGAPGLRPRPGPHRRAPLRLPPRAVDVGPGRPPVRGGRPGPRHPRLVHRRRAGLPGRAADRGPGPRGSTVWPCRTCRPRPGSSPSAGRPTVGASSTRPGGTPGSPPGDQAYLLGPYEELLRVLRHQHEGDVGTVAP